MNKQQTNSQMDLRLHPQTPRTVALELLWGCNLKCNYCYIGTEKNWQNPVVSKPSTICSIIDKIASAGVQEIYLVGGEPTAHPKFEEICTYIAQSSILVRGICTNGTLLTRPMAQMLKALNFYVDISFRGASDKVFDQITGVQGSFKKAVRGALILSEIDMPVGIEFDCTAQSASGLYPLIQTLVDLGVRVHHVFLHRIAPLGDASTLEDKGQVSLEDYKSIFEQAKRIKSDFVIFSFRLKISSGNPHLQRIT